MSLPRMLCENQTREIQKFLSSKEMALRQSAENARRNERSGIEKNSWKSATECKAFAVGMKKPTISSSGLTKLRKLKNL